MTHISLNVMHANQILTPKITLKPNQVFQLLVKCCDLILNFKVRLTIFSGCQNQLQTREDKARSIPSLDVKKIMNYFIFLVIFEELLNVAM
jgi:hypothetical protein